MKTINPACLLALSIGPTLSIDEDDTNITVSHLISATGAVP